MFQQGDLPDLPELKYIGWLFLALLVFAIGIGILIGYIIFQ